MFYFILLCFFVSTPSLQTNVNLQLLLKGSNTLSEKENADLLKLIHTYIKNTEKF